MTVGEDIHNAVGIVVGRGYGLGYGFETHSHPFGIFGLVFTGFGQ